MSKLIGDKKFYKYILTLMIPIFIQQGITNFVNMLDNVMVGRLGSAPMSGVAIANQFILIFNLCIFGAISGAGIFGAQFFGRGDIKNLRNTLRFKLLMCVIMSAVGGAVLIFFGKQLTQLFLKGEGEAAQAKEMLDSSLDYIKIIVVGFLPYSLAQTYASTLRETGKTFDPMAAGLVAVGINLFLNYVLIFGHFGFPRMGVRGAALATVISRFAELIYLALKTHIKRAGNAYAEGLYRSFHIPARLIRDIVKMGLPLMLNETLWALSFTLLAQSYSLRGLDVVAADNICHTFWIVFGCAFMSVGSTVSIVIGQQLGAGKHDEARDSAYKLIFFSFLIGVAVSAVYAALARYIPLAYNTSAAVRDMAFRLMLIDAALMPMDAIVHAAYFTVRSGGRVFITFAFDSGFAMLVIFPIAFFLVHFTSLSIYWIFFLSKGAVIIKAVIGLLLIRSGGWIKTLGADVSAGAEK